ncbi:MAG: prepilin-type cleavage/methylation domain-containing protein [Chloroflexi bacterium]|nr:prepilin-type cleavage/methylation domain-containing protein [Chloroflexota bacterium]
MATNSNKQFNRDSFTLIDTMLVVAIIGLLAVIAVPNFAKARNNARVKICIANLKQLEGAKQRWALENKKGDSATPAVTNIVSYLNGQGLPVCPAGGTYQLKRMDKDPSCSLSRSGHTLNNLNMDEDARPD